MHFINSNFHQIQGCDLLYDSGNVNDTDAQLQ